MIRTTVAVAAIAVVPATSEAQSTFRDTIVVTAAATPITLGTATRTVTVLSRDEISRLPVHSVADVLRLVAAVDVRARGERGVQTDFAVRGANFGQVLVLVDGIRINDAQSGHHNGDIPVPLDAIERIEVLHGGGSSLFGADAFGGTINIIMRRDAPPPSAVVEAGSFGLITGRGQMGFSRGAAREVLTAAVERSAGFMLERGFATASVSSRTTWGDGTGLLAGVVWKDFGANGFYGNAPSHEWTNQMLVAVDRGGDSIGGWRLASDASYRTHGDRFHFDVRRPGVAENEHRTHAVRGVVKGSRSVARAMLTVGIEAGADWIRSSNLGDHDAARISGFGEWRLDMTPAAQVDASVRVDRYSEFGSSWSPAVGVGWWAAPWLRLRASAGRSFRVPTFTERYYTDPNHLARADLQPETAWSGEASADVFLADGWSVGTVVFGRHEADVIDWLRPSTAVRWQTYNIRNVDTLGIELTLRRTLAAGAFVQAGYSGLDVEAEAVDQLSKYVLDYAPHGLSASASLPIGAGLFAAPRFEYRHRLRSTGTSDYAVFDLRLSRAFGNYELRIDGTNLFDANYQEVTGVAMPGAAFSVGLAFRR
jgi:iron complex outermembrane receptor protein